MSIEPKDVEYVANLSRVELREDEKETFTHQLADILDYIEKLNELDTTDVEPLTHVSPVRNVLREDQAKASLKTENALANTAERTRDFFRVPKVIE